MEGLDIPVGIAAGWTLFAGLAMSIITAIIRGKLVPGSAHDAMTADRNFYRDKLFALQDEMLTNINIEADRITARNLQRGLNSRQQGPAP